MAANNTNFLGYVQQPWNTGNFDDSGIAYPGGSATFDESSGFSRTDPFSGQPIGYGDVGHTAIEYDPNGNPVDWKGDPIGGYGNGSQEPVSNLPNLESGGFDLSKILGSIFGGGGGNNLAMLLPMYYASQRAADEHNEQAGRYEQTGERAAQMADPWGQSQRTKFQGKLDELLSDPTSSPVYQSMMREAMGALGPRLASQGRAGSDAGGGDWLRSIGDVSNKFTGEWADRFGRFGGSEVDPANAARMLMEGSKQAGDARNAALAARLMPLGALASAMSGDGKSGSGGGGGGGSNPLSGIMNYVKEALKGGKISPTDAGSLLKMLGSNAGSLANLWGNSPIGPGLFETGGDPSTGDWTFGDGTYPYDVTGNVYDPNYGNWTETDGGFDLGDIGNGGWDFGSGFDNAGDWIADDWFS